MCYNFCMGIIFLIGRILFGGYFFMMGLNHFTKNSRMAGYAASKGVPLPKLAVYVSGLLILLGGLGVLVGFYPSISFGLIALFLIVVTIKMHRFWEVQDPVAKMGDMNNFLKNLAMLGAALMFIAVFY